MMRWKGTASAIAALAFILAEPAGGIEPGTAYPSPDRPWTKTEYSDFLFRHRIGSQALPHLRNAAPRAIFERLVSLENVERIVASSESTDDKKVELDIILAVTNEIRASYNYQAVMGEPLQEELVRIQVFALDVIKAALGLSPVAIQASGKSAWRTALLGVFHSLSERSLYSDRQIIALSEALAARYAELSPLVDSTDKHSLETKLRSLIEGEPHKTVNDAFTRVLASVMAK